MWPYSVCQSNRVPPCWRISLILWISSMFLCSFQLFSKKVLQPLHDKYCLDKQIPLFSNIKNIRRTRWREIKKRNLNQGVNKFSEILQQMYPSHAAGINHCLSPTLVELCWFASAKEEFTKVPAGRRLPPLSHRLVRAVVSWSNQLGQIGCLYVFC